MYRDDTEAALSRIAVLEGELDTLRAKVGDAETLRLRFEGLEQELAEAKRDNERLRAALADQEGLHRRRLRGELRTDLTRWGLKLLGIVLALLVLGGGIKWCMTPPYHGRGGPRTTPPPYTSFEGSERSR
jgi:hypothetical protein